MGNVSCQSLDRPLWHYITIKEILLIFVYILKERAIY
jgi:hypothetical protein